MNLSILILIIIVRTSLAGSIVYDSPGTYILRSSQYHNADVLSFSIERDNETTDLRIASNKLDYTISIDETTIIEDTTDYFRLVTSSPSIVTVTYDISDDDTYALMEGLVTLLLSVAMLAFIVCMSCCVSQLLVRTLKTDTSGEIEMINHNNKNNYSGLV